MRGPWLTNPKQLGGIHSSPNPQERLFDGQQLQALVPQVRSCRSEEVNLLVPGTQINNHPKRSPATVYSHCW